MAGMFDDLLSYLMGGTQMGNFLGVGSPTASTQTPVIGPLPGSPTLPGGAGPMLGGAPAPAGGGGLLSGLLGGQAPVNAASYFQPKPGLLGDSPLGNMLQGAFGGLASVQPGQKGLAAFGAGAQGGQQAVQERQKQQMATVLAGQQYKQGQQTLVSGALANESALLHINNIREFNGLAPVTMADITADPSLVSNPTQGQPPAPGSAAATGQTAPTQPAAPAAPAGPIDPTVLPPGQSVPTVMSPTGVGTNVQRQPLDQIKQAFLQYEGGGNPNAVDPKSGAIAGLTPGTFDLYNKKFFGGKLNFANPGDRDTVNTQLLKDLYTQAGGDVNRVAAGYFTGQMAPPGSPTPWVDPNATDANGTNVVDYVNHIRKNLMLPPIDAGGAAAQGQQAPSGQTAGGGQQTTGAPQMAAGGGFPQTRAEIEASPLPDWAKQALITAHMSGDYGEVAKVETDLGKYFGAPGQAAATQQATQGVTYQGPQAQLTRANDLRTFYTGQEDYKKYHEMKPQFDAGMAAYDAYKKGTGNDYDLINSAITLMGGAGIAKPGVAASVTDTGTLPEQLAKTIQKIVSDGSALPVKVAESLRDTMVRRMAGYQTAHDTLVANVRKIAEGQGIKESDWNIDAPDPNAGVRTNPNTGKPWAKGDKATDASGNPMIYSGQGDPLDPKNWSLSS